ncbi:HAD family hydrolase [Geobacter pelophilus]|uniref:phosphoglycolate phosphatase n=1 Tax=Geoanaerobacter pelophilus TaxID=60036 RepID=A0AAW4L8L2_9BACT|nr:HAD family hydrolase [Geoanaerobacter pelophilus]MBT0665378.1 HAD family hydrolase [Geoanaerobacter pelophilus]
MIRAGIFDLDGTLYFADSLGREIGRVAALYISTIKGIDQDSAWELIRDTRKRLSNAHGLEASLSVACQTLGGDLRELHRVFAAEIVPEAHLGRDEAIISLLTSLAAVFPLYIYTNNNVSLSARIMEAIGVSHLFQRVFTIEDDWCPKPNKATIEAIMSEIGRVPSECLFVGDRFDIDLRLPESLGATVHLVSCREDLLSLKTYVL